MSPDDHDHADLRSRICDLEMQLAMLQQKVPPVVHAIERLDVKPGDVLHVRVGDPEVGFIPAAGSYEPLIEIFRKLFETRGVDVVFTDYTFKCEVVAKS